MVSLLDLEKKASDLKAELEKALEENVLLQKKVDELSELQPPPNTVEMQQTEVNKSRTILQLVFLLCFLYCI